MTDRLEAELHRSGFKTRFGEKRFFELRADALKYVWQQLELSNQVQEEDNPEDLALLGYLVVELVYLFQVVA